MHKINIFLNCFNLNSEFLEYKKKIIDSIFQNTKRGLLIHTVYQVERDVMKARKWNKVKL